MKTALTLIIAAAFATTAVQAEDAKPVGKTVVVAQQNDLPAGGLNPGIVFGVLGLGAIIAVGIAAGVGGDDDNNATNGSNQPQ